MISLARVVRNTAAPLGGNDLYTYWYAGLFIRQGHDLYHAFIQSRTPNLPIDFLDGSALTPQQIQVPPLVPAPGYTYPLFLLLTPLSFFTWQTAKWLWLSLQMGLVAMIFPLMRKTIPTASQLPLAVQVAFVLFLFGSTSSRYALSSGQIIFFLLLLMLSTILLAEKKPWLAGIALGLALSKYSVAVGLFLYYLLIEPKPRLILVASLVQIAGVVALSLSSGSSVPQVLHGYLLMLEYHQTMEGIQLASLLPQRTFAVDFVIALCLTLPTWILLWRKKSSTPSAYQRAIFVCVVMGWSLLIAYHRAYDLVIFTYILFVFANLLFSSNFPQSAAIPGKLLAGFSFLFFLLPSGELARQLLPDFIGIFWTMIYNRLATFMVLTSLVISLAILYTPTLIEHWERSYESDCSREIQAGN